MDGEGRATQETKPKISQDIHDYKDVVGRATHDYMDLGGRTNQETESRMPKPKIKEDRE